MTFLCSSACSSRNASTLSTSDLLSLIIMSQNMYPSNTDQDDPNPEVENDDRLTPTHVVSHLISDCLLSISVHVVCLSLKDIESTSGSGPESFYTPEPSPTDMDSRSSGWYWSLCINIYPVITL